MITEVLLTNENYIRAVTIIDNNLQSKYLLSAIREAQDVGLQQIIGTPMLNKLKTLVENDTINATGNTAYKKLIDEAQLYLCFQTITNLTLCCNVKFSNGGLQQCSDENLNVMSLSDTFLIRDQFQGKADFYAHRLQDYILSHRDELPEISERKCHQMNSELHSAASTSVWLGSKRSPVGGWINKRYRKF